MTTSTHSLKFQITAWYFSLDIFKLIQLLLHMIYFLQPPYHCYWEFTWIIEPNTFCSLFFTLRHHWKTTDKMWRHQRQSSLEQTYHKNCIMYTSKWYIILQCGLQIKNMIHCSNGYYIYYGTTCTSLTSANYTLAQQTLAVFIASIIYRLTVQPQLWVNAQLMSGIIILNKPLGHWNLSWVHKLIYILYCISQLELNL